MIQLLDGERLDDTGFGGIKVIQKKGLGYGVDAVLLAAFAAGETGAGGIEEGSSVTDLGTGNGIVAFIISHKVRGSRIVGIEKRSEVLGRALRGAELNGLNDRVCFVNADVKGYECREKFDAVVTNPPYFRKNSAIPSGDSDRFDARHETTAELGDFLGTASRMLKQGGDFYMVHRPDRLADIICGMRQSGIEPKEIQFVVPRAGESSNIVLVHGVRGAGAEMKILPEIAVHDEGQGYSDTIEMVYERSGLKA